MSYSSRELLSVVIPYIIAVRALTTLAELKKYVSGLDAQQENIFTDNFSWNRWKQICMKLVLDDFKFHAFLNMQQLLEAKVTYWP